MITWKSNLETTWGIKIPGWKSSLAWLVGVTLLTALSLYGVGCIYEEYKFNNVATRVDIIAIDKNFRPPQMFALIPLYKVENQQRDLLFHLTQHVRNGTIDQCRICKIVQDKGWDVWSDKDIVEYGVNDPVQFYYALSLAFTRKLFRMMDTGAGKDFFSDTSSLVDEITFSAALNYLILHADVDDFLKTPKRLRGVSRLFEENFPKEKYKMDLLRDRVLYRVCQEITFIEYNPINAFLRGHPTNKSCHDILAREAVMFGSDGLFVTLPYSREPKNKEYVIGIKNAVSPWSESVSTPSEGVPEKTVVIYPDTSHFFSSTIDQIYSSYIIQSQMKKDTGLQISIGYSVKLRVRETTGNWQKCDNGSSATVCYVNCTKKHIIRHCDCVPFIFERLVGSYPDLPYCSLKNYLKCNVTEIPANIQDHCMDRCKSACEYTTYTWQTDAGYYEPQRQNFSAELALKLAPSFHTFPELLWVEKSTQEQFLSQIGGIVNLYLGFSGISVIGFVLLCFEFLQKWQRNQNMAGGAGTSASMDRRDTTVALSEFPSMASVLQSHNEWRAEIDEIKAILNRMQGNETFRRY